VIYAIVAYAAAAVLWVAWIIALRAREGRIRRWRLEGDR
jgi:hypothetical protein